MTKSEAIAHFGSVRDLAAALGIKAVQSVYGWPDDGVPMGRQWQIQVLTKGKLKVDKEPKKRTA
ncbi:MAG TPA: Cro/CI family transcriptional regulator [Moraxellaceae bacterium]|nr:Cro/CI family transcriptional regulator [Moraxellaceae bacterium]